MVSITFTDGVLKTDAAPTVTYTAGTLKDLNGNALASTGALAMLDSAGPAISNVVTRDTNGNGYIDPLVVSFSENVDASTIVPGSYSVSAGSISGVVDNGAPNDAVIWVNLVDGVLRTNAVPTLSIAAGGIQDLAGNGNPGVSNHVSVDGAPPVITSRSIGCRLNNADGDLQRAGGGPPRGLWAALRPGTSCTEREFAEGRRGSRAWGRTSTGLTGW